MKKYAVINEDRKFSTDSFEYQGHMVVAEDEFNDPIADITDMEVGELRTGYISFPEFQSETKQIIIRVI